MNEHDHLAEQAERDTWDYATGNDPYADLYGEDDYLNEEVTEEDGFTARDHDLDFDSPGSGFQIEDPDLTDSGDSLDILAVYNNQIDDVYQPPKHPKKPRQGAYDNADEYNQAVEVYLSQVEDYEAAQKEANDHNRELGLTIQNNPDPAKVKAAKDELVLRHLTVAVSRAQRKAQIPGLELHDFIQEANIGLIEAAESWDPDYGTWFAQYARTVIDRRLMATIVNQSRNIRLPKHISDIYFKKTSAEDKLWQELGREPTLQELSAETGIPERQLTTLIEDENRYFLSDNVDDGEGNVTERIDTVVPQPEPALDRIPYSREPNPETLYIRNETIRNLEGALRSLTPKQTEVVRLRYGLDTGQPLTQEEIACELGISRNAVKERERLAFIRLRHPNYGIVPDSHPLATADA